MHHHIHINKRNVWQAVFILIILYSVSSINVLVIVLGVLPYLQEILYKLNILIYFATISFMLAAFLSIYHIRIMFQKRKRKTDTEETHNVQGFKGIWERSRPVTKIFFVLICVYALFSIFIMAWTNDVTKNIVAAYDVEWIIFSLFSFGMATVIAAYHLSTWVLRRKRASDHNVIVNIQNIQD